MKTSEMLDLGNSDNGGYTAAQLELIGVSWPPCKGWAKDASRKTFQPEVMDEFVKLRNMTIKAELAMARCNLSRSIE